MSDRKTAFEAWVKVHGPQVPIVYLPHDAYAHAWMTAQYEGWKACWEYLNGCEICGDMHESIVPRGCETGDGE